MLIWDGRVKESANRLYAMIFSVGRIKNGLFLICSIVVVLLKTMLTEKGIVIVVNFEVAKDFLL
ncbi:hypothetical protein D1839_08145 [Roseburia sp. 1XD42-34]|nr:hypothetical protein [Roseburia sp. 1XD42-34]RKI78832.1 hypothetical protein D7V87_08135 [Clostridium sp. 1xD42-85]